MILLEAPPPGYAMFLSVGLGAAVVPVASRWGSRFIASVVVIDASKNRAELSWGCWPTVNMRSQVGSTPKIGFGLQQKRISGLLSFFYRNPISCTPKSYSLMVACFWQIILLSYNCTFFFASRSLYHMACIAHNSQDIHWKRCFQDCRHQNSCCVPSTTLTVVLHRSLVANLMRPWGVFEQFLILLRCSAFSQILLCRPPCISRFLIISSSSAQMLNL